MKFNWAKLVHEMRIHMMEMVAIEGQDQAHTLDLVGYFRLTMQETDTFHPFDHDKDLERAFDRMPVRCNYSSIKSYWAYKDARANLADAVYGYFIAMETLIRDHFSNPMNFPPGYFPPRHVKFGDLETHAAKIIPMTLRLIKM